MRVSASTPVLLCDFFLNIIAHCGEGVPLGIINSLNLKGFMGHEFLGKADKVRSNVRKKVEFSFLESDIIFVCIFDAF